MTAATILPLLASIPAHASDAFPLTPRWWLPESASTFSNDVDSTFAFIYWVDVVFFLIIVAAMVYFAFAYRRRKEGQRTSPVKGNHALEFAWSFIPTLFLIAFFVMGFRTYMDMQIPPADSMDIRVTGQKWNWSFEYPEQGITLSSADGLVVPSNTPVRLTITSVDVLHSFFIPAFRTKKDAVPNRYTSEWFQAKHPGDYHIFCAEYCGDDHSRMTSTVHVLEASAFKEWVADHKAASDSMSPAERGQKLFNTQGCAACHAVDGTRLVGPSLNGKYGVEEQLTDGSTVMVDDNYIRESLESPGAKIVAGFAPQMPPYQGRLKDDEISALIDFIKSLNEEE